MPLLRLNVAVLLLAACCSAWAAQHADGAPGFSINGFGTLSAVRSSETRADFANGPLRPNGPGHTHTWSAAPDSRLGVQLTAQPSRDLSSVLQLISEQQNDGSYRPRVEWANVQLRLSDALSVRVGRIARPAFLSGDHRKVGYTMPWVRPPLEVYSMLPGASSDGVDAGYRFTHGAVNHDFQIFVGNSDAKGPVNSNVLTRDGLGLAYRSESGGWTVRSSYLQSKLTVDGPQPLFDAYRGFGAAGRAIAERYETRRKNYRLATLGAGYDAGSWFIIGEAARVWNDSWMGDRTGWYLGAGHSFGDVTPYFVLAGIKSDSPTSTSGLDHPGAAGLNERLNDLLALTPVQKSISVGVRWDVVRDLALKAQFDYMDIADGSSGHQVNLQPGFVRGKNLKLFSVALDFVF